MIKWFKRLHLSAQFILLFSIAFGLLAVSISMFFFYTQKAFEEANKTYSEDIISQLVETVNANYNSLYNILYFLSFQSDVQNFLLCEEPAERYELFTQMRQNLVSGTELNPHIIDIAIVDARSETYFLSDPYYMLPDLENAGRTASLSKLLTAKNGIQYFTLGTSIFNLSSPQLETAIGEIYLILDVYSFASGKAGNYEGVRSRLYLSDRNDRIFWSNFPTDEITIKNLDPATDKKIFLPEMGIYLTASLQKEDTIYSLYNVQNTFFLFLLGMLVFLMCLIIVYIHNLLSPLRTLYNFIAAIKEDGLRGLRNNIVLTGCYEMAVIGDEINGMLQRMDDLTKQLFKTTTQLYEAKLMKNEAELQFMRSQINPHFLYNTLDSITGLAAQENVPKIVKLTKALSAIFKYSIKGDAEVALEAELKIMKNYISIQLVRFGDRFRVQYDVEAEAAKKKVPKMILQPLVENAIIHGIENYEGIALLCISAQVDDQNRLKITVYNEGIPIPENKLARIQEQLKREPQITSGQELQSIGIYNVNNRIKLTYGPEYGLELIGTERGTAAVLAFPAM